MILGLAMGCLVPASASASTIASDAGPITFRTGPGERSDMALVGWGGIFLDNQFWTLTDARSTLKPLGGCLPRPAVTCAGLNFDVRLGDGADRAKVKAAADVTESGGKGDDELYGWGNGVDLAGGDGNDLVIGDSNGSANVNGNFGDDRLYGAGDGTRLVGSDGQDLLVAATHNFAYLDGGNSDDEIVADQVHHLGTVLAGAGNDVVVVRPGQWSDGTWTIDGGAGDDEILGSPEADAVTGAGGADVIGVDGDGVADTVSCGGGYDVVYAGTEDTVNRDCESVRRGAMPISPDIADAIAHADAVVAGVAGIDARVPGPMFGSAF
jgi:Ca2+-binding RTX toxin-like protein